MPTVILLRRARPYRAKFAPAVERLCRLGATLAEVAAFFGVTSAVIQRWIERHPDFAGAVRRGLKGADAHVARSLYRRATGYDVDAVEVLLPDGATEPVHVPYRAHVPPDPAAAILWLTTRRPDLWRDDAATAAPTPADPPAGRRSTGGTDRLPTPGATPRAATGGQCQCQVPVRRTDTGGV